MVQGRQIAIDLCNNLFWLHLEKERFIFLLVEVAIKFSVTDVMSFGIFCCCF